MGSIYLLLFLLQTLLRSLSRLLYQLSSGLLQLAVVWCAGEPAEFSQSVQNAAARLLTNTVRRDHITPVLCQLTLGASSETIGVQDCVPCHQKRRRFLKYQFLKNIVRKKTDRQTNAGENCTPATSIGVDYSRRS